MNRAGELVTILVPTEREERVRDYTEDELEPARTRRPDSLAP